MAPRARTHTHTPQASACPNTLVRRATVVRADVITLRCRQSARTPCWRGGPHTLSAAARWPPAQTPPPRACARTHMPCVCALRCVWVGVSACARARPYTCAATHSTIICLYSYIYTYIHIHMYEYSASTATQTLCVHTRTHTHTHLCARAHAHTSVCARARVRARTRACACV